MNTFQTIVLGIFAFFIIAGLIVIATVKAKGDVPPTALTIWGTVSQDAVTPLISEFFDSDTLAITYQPFSPETFDQELIEALAASRGPDMVLLPAELLLRYRDKIVTIPFATYSERLFRDTFIQGAELFLAPDGIYALPFSVDPLVMYYNRDMLEAGGFTAAPRFWDEFLALGAKLTRRDASGNISRSAVALGEYRNIAASTEIIAAMFIQSGNRIVDRDGRGVFYSVLAQSSAPAVLDFYTEFANPLKPSYSWNRAQPSSRSAFLASRLAIYFGFGSEYSALRQGNPNLNFDVTFFPGPRSDNELGITYGKLTGIAILRSSLSPSAALGAAFPA